METSGRGKTGNQRAGQPARRHKKACKARKTSEVGTVSDKKNFSSRNINKIIKNVKMEDQQRKNTLKYSAHNKRPKPKEFFYRRTKNKRATGESEQHERGSAQAEIRRYLEGGRKVKKRVKTTRMLTEGQSDSRNKPKDREKSADWVGNQAKNLENELSMSDNRSETSLKSPIHPRETAKGDSKAQAVQLETRKKKKFQLASKNKSRSKLAYKPMQRQPKTDKARKRKGLSKFRLVKTPQAKKKFLNKELLQKKTKDSQQRIHTVAGSPLPESDGFKRLQKKGRLPKSTRNVVKAGQTFFANSTNNIPLINDLHSERIDFKLAKVKRFSKKSKSKSNAGKLTGLNLGEARQKKSVFCQKNRKLNNTYTYDMPSKTGRSLGFSKLSSNQRTTSRSPCDVIPLKQVPKRPQLKNFSVAYEKGRSRDFSQKAKQPHEFVMKGSFSQFKNLEGGDRPIFFKKPDFYHIKDVPKAKVVKYRESARPRNGLRTKNQINQSEMYVTPSLDYKIYSQKNLENLPKTSIMQMNVAQGNWHSQRNSHPNMIELIRVPIQTIENYPVDEGQIYYQKSKTQGASRPQSHLSSYGEFPSSPYARYVPHQMGSKQYIGPREAPRNSKRYYGQEVERRQFDGIMAGRGMEQEIYKFRDFQPGAVGYLADSQRYLMFRQASDEGSVWFKTRLNENQDQGMSSPPQGKPPK